MMSQKTRKVKRINPSFHILITTIGRPTLHRLLNSLKSELTSNDAITIIFDGEEAYPKSGLTKEWLKGHKADIFIIENIPNTGFWGHPVLNKYQGKLMKKTTYIMLADDDDKYLKGSFSKLRCQCKDKDTLYIGKMCYDHDKTKIIPRQNEKIVASDIGKVNGIIPFRDISKSSWGYHYLGDFDYYDKLQHKVKDVVFLDTIFYKVYK
jgi:hypothetical protein